MARIRKGTDAEYHAAVADLRSWPAWVFTPDLVHAYGKTHAKAQRDRLYGAYFALTREAIPSMRD